MASVVDQTEMRLPDKAVNVDDVSSYTVSPAEADAFAPTFTRKSPPVACMTTAM